MPTSSLDTNGRIWSFLCGDAHDDDDDFADADDSKHVVYGGLPGRGHKGLDSGGGSAAWHSQLWHPKADVGPRYNLNKKYKTERRKKHKILLCAVFFGFSRCKTDRLTWDFGGDLLLQGPRCLLGAVESHGMEDSTRCKTAHSWYFAPILIQSWDNILILTSTILDLMMKKAAGSRGWWWKAFAWLYGRRHAKFLRAISFCSILFANGFSQTALRFLSLEIWLVKMRNTTVRGCPHIMSANRQPLSSFGRPPLYQCLQEPPLRRLT